MGDAAVGLSVQHLKQLLDYHPNIIIDVKEQVEHLYKDLSLFNAFAKEFIGNRALEKEFVKQIRDLVHRSEDTVDKYISLAVMHKSRNKFMKAILKLNYDVILGKVKSDIESIRADLKNMFDTKFEIESLQVGEGSTYNEKSPIVEEKEMVGFQDEAEKVITLLTNDFKEREVISIIGMLGLGKTTLSKMIFHHHKIKDQFENRAWVNVSHSYNRKEVFLTILDHFIEPTDEVYKMTDDNLGKELCQILEKRKYLIVLDDVWTPEAWDNLENAFPKNSMYSRILLTSRMSSVAKHANPKRDPHKLRRLSRDESWSLLRKKALSPEVCSVELERLGMRIVNQCMRLPLAIVVIGEILLKRGSGSLLWEKVAECVNMHLFFDPEERINKFIAPSFNHLPHHLKICFLYFGMFPKEFQISKHKLVRLWIAEGFIQQRNGMCLEDIAEEYLEDLVNMNLVMVLKWGLNGTIKTCQVHNILHEFCKKRAQSEELFLEVKCDYEGPSSPSSHVIAEARRLCIHSDYILDFISSRPPLSRIRSFFCFSSRLICWTPELMSSFAGAFELVRVFVFSVETLKDNHFLIYVSQLIHLRYLVLWGNIEIIPAAISKLWNMQTLDIKSTSLTLVIEADIRKMTQLRHIITNVPTSIPVHLAKTGNHDSLIHGSLQTLTNLATESCIEDVFAKATKLRKLGICGRLNDLLKDEVKGGFDCLCNLNYLKKLKLQNDASALSEKFILPQAGSFPPKLKKLTLSGTLIDWDHMSTLGKLENLEILKLKNNAFMGERWQTENGGFRNLNILYIKRTNLVSWHTSANHLPRLRCLYLRYCRQLEAVPLCLAHISNLQVIDLCRTNESVGASARKIQQHKQRMEEKKKTIGTGFKLSIVPSAHGVEP